LFWTFCGANALAVCIHPTVHPITQPIAVHTANCAGVAFLHLIPIDHNSVPHNQVIPHANAHLAIHQPIVVAVPNIHQTPAAAAIHTGAVRAVTQANCPAPSIYFSAPAFFPNRF
jgi:hypothetical protein